MRPGRMGPSRAGVPFEKVNTFESIKKLLEYSKSFVPVFIVASVLAIIGAFLSVISPQFLAKLTDSISLGLTGTMDFNSIRSISILVVCFYVFSLIFSSTQGVLMAKTSGKIAQFFRRDIAKKINKMPLNYFDTVSKGDIMSRITNDVDLIGQTLNNGIVNLFSSLVMFLGTIVMMFATNWILALSAIGASLVGFVIMFTIMIKSQKYFEMQQKTLGKINGHIEETYSGQNVIKAYNSEKSVIATFRAINQDLFTAGWKSGFFSGIMHPLMMFVGNLNYVVVCVIGAVLALNGTISFGVIVAFTMYIRLFSQPLGTFAQIGMIFQQTAAASKRVFEFLEEKEIVDCDSNSEKSETKGNVDFNNVRFGYTKEKTIIHDFSLTVKKGQKIAIVGPTGAGKTTLINLLMRFYELDSGSIEVDGQNIATMSYEELRDKFCMVLQDTWLFEGSVRDNIVYSEENVTDEQLENACKAAGIYHFVHSLPNGYDTVLNDTTTISQGQKQLITIARAMIEDAPMLILDEATSSVDTRTEILIQNAMDNLMQGRTSFVIAHRLSTIKNADVILVLNEGDIVEQGSHDELLALNGFYASLYNSQFEQ